ncbi:hypothetical protein HJC23_011916 [Cyclotella cryptica]|uniref:Uncharacterized protein n=1 Tax=Cyclotella cryptica TaxID=29204 RepID=A0ABD3NM68_9STRA|eukprot:CCRYP_020467-RA/>CCRYP_020467-RA protein AED:0.29 eAED:0.29 QI:0/-1/0/1/-1/1/1/0/573
MNLSGISDETRRQLFGKGKDARRISMPNKPPALAPPITTFQSLDENGFVEVPEISASTPVRCSLGEKDRPAGWQNLLERRLQKGPLSPITTLTVNKSGKTIAKNGEARGALSTAEKATMAYRQKKAHNETSKSLSTPAKIRNDLKRQSSLAAAAAASSPGCKTNMNEPSHTTCCLPSKTNSGGKQMSSLARVASPPNTKPLTHDIAASTLKLISKYATPKVEGTNAHRVTGPQSTTKSENSYETQQEPKSDLYFDPSPMSRLRSKSPPTKPNAAQTMKRPASNNENQGSSNNASVLKSAASAMLENRLQNVTSVAALQNTKTLIGFMNQDFGNSNRGLLATGNLRAMPERSAESKTTVAVKNPAPSMVKRSVYQRREDRIKRHKRNVGSTLKSIGIVTEKKVPARKAEDKVQPEPKTSPKKTFGSTSQVSPDGNKRSHREEVYEAVSRRRCLLLQERRGVVSPSVNSRSYERYSFLEKKRLQMLGQRFDDSRVATNQNAGSSSNSTVVTIQSNSYDMMAQAVKRRKARLALAKQQQEFDIAPTLSNDSQSSSASEKRRKAIALISRDKMRLLQ